MNRNLSRLATLSIARSIKATGTLSGMRLRNKRAGFSLVELVVVIAITGVIASTVGVFILRPVQGYEAQVRRGELVDAAESALRRMQRDIRRALPNSIRVRDSLGNVDNVTCLPAGGKFCVLELLHTIDGGRYRADPPGPPFTRLQFGVVDTDFDVLGGLQDPGIITGTDWLVINNQTTVGTEYNAYFGDNRAQISSVTPTHVTFAATNFPATLASTNQRFYIINTPITYLCDSNSAARTLTRYDGYPIQVDQASIDTPGELIGVGAQASRIADFISSCELIYQPGVSARSGLVTLAITILDPQTNEQIRLLHQVHIHNVP